MFMRAMRILRAPRAMRPGALTLTLAFAVAVLGSVAAGLAAIWMATAVARRTRLVR